MGYKFKNRKIEIQGEYVSCTTCAVNYNKDGLPVYCQEFNTDKNPRDILKNHQTAKECKYYCPIGLERWARVIGKKSEWEK